MYSMHLYGNSTIVCFLEKNLVLKIEMRLAAKFINIFSPYDFILRVGLSCKVHFGKHRCHCTKAFPLPHFSVNVLESECKQQILYIVSLEP